MFVRRRVEQVLSWRLDRVIAVSDRVKEEMVRDIGIRPGKISVIKNGIAILPVPLEGGSAERRGEIGLAEGDFLICAVGRLAPIKNYGMLLDALPEVWARAERPVKLIFIGDGPERARLEELARARGGEGKVFFLGERSDVREWLALGNVFVLSSFYEGVSIALLEAMSMGLPAVATRVGGTPDVVRHEETGLLVDVGRPAEMAEAILTLEGDEEKRLRMGAAARKLVEAEYDLKKVVKRYEDIYLEKLAARAARRA
jgi:glycosyltransferase involved in cell wall biosynthesis